MGSIVAAIGLVLLALGHSVLGERELLRPLFARPWDIGLPRQASERILRFAWHLTSFAWLGLGCLALGVPVLPVIAVVALASGLVIFFMLRGHLAWPIFFAVAVAAGLAGGSIGQGVLSSLVLVAAVGLALAGLVHVQWALGGGERRLAVAVPTDATGRPVLRTPWWASLAVGTALLGVAATAGSRALGWAVPGQGLVLALAAIAFALRAVGELHYVGFTKTHRNSAFARLDDAIYTPLCVLFAFGCAAALLL